jgi:hypothetical protein
MDNQIFDRVDLGPMGVSQWMNIGEKYGYYDYFKKELREIVIDECISEVIRLIDLKGSTREKDNELIYKLNNLK